MPDTAPFRAATFAPLALRAASRFADNSVRGVADALDLSVSELYALLVLRENDNLDAAALAPYIGITRAGVDRLSNDLALRGVVARAYDLGDHGEAHIRLTKPGRELAEQAVQALQAQRACAHGE